MEKFEKSKNRTTELKNKISFPTANRQSTELKHIPAQILRKANENCLR